jgi:predicted O-linked N-acetylglucosamine transferase (SPINDLY family)
LKTASLPELVTADAASFQALAVQLAKDPARLGKFRTRLSQGRASNALFDTRRFTAGLEQALETMVGRQRKGHAAESFAVAAPK